MKDRLNINKVKTIIENNNVQVNDKLYEIFKMYKTGEYIYIDAIVRYTKIKKEIIISILELLTKEQILSKYYSITCQNCGHSVNHFYTKEELKDEIYCDHCDERINTDICKSVYKVL